MYINNYDATSIFLKCLTCFNINIIHLRAEDNTMFIYLVFLLNLLVLTLYDTSKY